jgi:hypothetical protein
VKRSQRRPPLRFEPRIECARIGRPNDVGGFYRAYVQRSPLNRAVLNNEYREFARRLASPSAPGVARPPAGSDTPFGRVVRPAGQSGIGIAARLFTPVLVMPVDAFACLWMGTGR